jgi:hypothetical protein
VERVFPTPFTDVLSYINGRLGDEASAPRYAKSTSFHGAGSGEEKAEARPRGVLCGVPMPILGE